MQGRFTSRRFAQQTPKLLAEINVTPFVDVMLVLLIVFMVTAPLLTVGVPVDLPKSQAKNLSDPIEPIIISLNKESKIFIQDKPIKRENLLARLEVITKNNHDAQIYLRADKHISYGKVMTIMGQVNAAGFSKLALIAEAQD